MNPKMLEALIDAAEEYLAGTDWADEDQFCRDTPIYCDMVRSTRRELRTFLLLNSPSHEPPRGGGLS